jgi:hypothetical protein
MELKQVHPEIYMALVMLALNLGPKSPIEKKALRKVVG